jgi:hypothetical protein
MTCSSCRTSFSHSAEDDKCVVCGEALLMLCADAVAHTVSSPSQSPLFHTPPTIPYQCISSPRQMLLPTEVAGAGAGTGEGGYHNNRETVVQRRHGPLTDTLPESLDTAATTAALSSSFKLHLSRLNPHYDGTHLHTACAKIQTQLSGSPPPLQPSSSAPLSDLQRCGGGGGGGGGGFAQSAGVMAQMQAIPNHGCGGDCGCSHIFGPCSELGKAQGILDDGLEHGGKVSAAQKGMEKGMEEMQGMLTLAPSPGSIDGNSCGGGGGSSVLV